MSINFRLHAAAATAVTILAVTGCDRGPTVNSTPLPEPVAKTKTLETSKLGAAVDAYERAPGAATKSAVKKAQADLDGEIAELQKLVAERTGAGREEAAAKLKNLQEYRAAETARFTAAEAKAALTTGSTAPRPPAIDVPPAAPPVPDARSGAEKVEDSAKKVGESIGDGVKKAGEAIKDAVK